jgi:type IV fimbrial biogenesis protein FimT
VLNINRHFNHGATLIELMIALSVLGLLLVLGLPSYTTWIQNTQIRSAAESLQSGLQLARAEAVRRNGLVQFVMTNDDPLAANVSTVTAAQTGQNWMIRYQDPTTSAWTFIQGKGGAEGAGKSTPNVGLDAGGSANATVTFSGLGRASPATTYQITNSTGGTCISSGGPMRCLSVVVASGGQIRMCDPSISTAGDTRKC